MALGLLAAVIFTHAFDRAGDTDAVGIFTMLVIYSEMFTLVVNLGLLSTLPKLIAAAPSEKRPTIAWSALFFQTAASIAVAIPIYLLWKFLDDPARISTNESWLTTFPYLWVLPLLVLFGNLRENALTALAGFDRYGARAIGLIVNAIANVVFIVILVQAMNWGLPGLLYATVLTYLAGALWFCAGLPRFKRSELDWNEYKRAAAFSLPLYVNSLLGYAYQRCDTLFVAWLMGPAQAAFFEFGAKRFSTYLNRILVAALTPFLPAMSVLAARKDFEGATRMWNAVSFTFTAGGYTGVLALVSIQEWLVGVLFPAEYAGALPAMGLILAAGVLYMQSGVSGLSLIAFERPAVITAINFVAAIASFACNWMLIPRFGMFGAGIAAIVAAGFSDAAQTWCVARAGMAVSWLRFTGLHALFAGCLIASNALKPGAWAVVVPFAFVGLCFTARLVRASDIATLSTGQPRPSVQVGS